MLLTTTPTIEGRPIRNYLGVITGETIIGANVIKDVKAAFTDFFGGRSGAYERALVEAKDQQQPQYPCSLTIFSADVSSKKL